MDAKYGGNEMVGLDPLAKLLIVYTKWRDSQETKEERKQRTQNREEAAMLV